MPRMRTVAEAAAELKRADPNTTITPYAIRKLVLSGEIPNIKAGKKQLVKMKVLERCLC